MSSEYSTKTSRKNTYPAIDPLRSELSAKDKTIIITGNDELSIGSSAAFSFAKAGAPKIALIGSKEGLWENTKERLEAEYSNIEVLISIADLSSPQSVGIAAHHIRVTLGAWDVFVHSAESIPPSTTLTGADEDHWWTAFETNVRFTQIFSKHFLSKCRLNATYIAVNSAIHHTVTTMNPKTSAYVASKLAAAKLDEYLAAENPSLRVFTVSPAGINPKILGLSNQSSSEDNTRDDLSLSANFFVWLASPLSEYLKSRFISANWDVDELTNRKSEIESDPRLFRLMVKGE